MQILTSNSKLVRSGAHGYLTLGIQMAPHTIGSGGPRGFTVCPDSTLGCRASCIFTAGRGQAKGVMKARIDRKRMWMAYPSGFYSQLHHEIALARKRAKKLGLKLAIRLNTFSDIPWEQVHPVLFPLFSDTMFYDYTKSADRMMRSLLDPRWPQNYDLTWSTSETNDADTARVVAAGGRIAVPTRSQTVCVPGAKDQYQYSNGDIHDLTFLWPRKTILMLSPKGKGKADTTGFIRA